MPTDNQLLAIALIIIALFLIQIITKRYISKFLRIHNFGYQRRKVIIKIIDLLSILVAAILIIATLGIDRKDLVVFITSGLTILGIGFFAQWSILSNISASLILFFNHPIKLGDRIRILDKDYPVVGKVSDITFFFIHIKTDEGLLITVPNNLALQKSVQIETTEKSN